MNGIGGIRIRLELEEMKATILTVLHERELEIENAVREQMDRVIDSFDFQGVIAAEVERCLKESIEYFYRYGDGHNYIREAIASVLRDLHEEKNEDSVPVS